MSPRSSARSRRSIDSCTRSTRPCRRCGMATSSSAPAETYEPAEIARRVQRDLERNFLRFRNGIKLRLGVDRPGLGLAPKDTIWTHDKMQLWRYRSDQRRYRTPVLMVMSLVSRSYI